jgi:hypothetical protein
MGDNTLAVAGWQCDIHNPQHATEVLHEACVNRCWLLEKDSQRSQQINPPERLSIDGSSAVDIEQVSSICGAAGSSLDRQYHYLQQQAQQTKPVLAVNLLWQKTCITPQKLTASFWMEVCAGTKGIGYMTFFTNEQKDKPLRDRAGQMRNHFASWEPSFFGPRIAVSSGTSKIAVCAFRAYGAITAIAVNLTNKPTKTTVTVAGTGNHRALMYKESAAVRVSKVKFAHGKLKLSLPEFGVGRIEVP